MKKRDFAWFESELARRLVELQVRSPGSDMEHVIRGLDIKCIEQLSDEALVFAAERFARYHRLPWGDARGLMLAETDRRRLGRERKILSVAIATLIVAALGSIAAFASLTR